MCRVLRETREQDKRPRRLEVGVGSKSGAKGD